MDKGCKNERRYRRIPVSEDQIIGILEGRIVLRNLDFPDDVRVVGVNWDYQSLCFSIGIESASFDPVPPGEIIPRLPPWSLQIERV